MEILYFNPARNVPAKPYPKGLFVDYNIYFGIVKYIVSLNAVSSWHHLPLGTRPHVLSYCSELASCVKLLASLIGTGPHVLSV